MEKKKERSKKGVSLFCNSDRPTKCKKSQKKVQTNNGFTTAEKQKTGISFTL